MSKKADMGIGTLIIFIAMILVAAIAASVLIQTAGSLQNKALITGDKAKQQVGNSILVTQVYAQNGSVAYHTISKFFLMVKLGPGSDSIKLNDTIINIGTRTKSADLSYGGTSCIVSNTDYSATGYYTAGSGIGNYTVNYLNTAVGHIDGYLLPGEMIKICLKTPVNITEDDSVSFMIIPKVGSSTKLMVNSPSVIKDVNVYIYP